MSAFQIPHKDRCPECDRPTMEVGDDLCCANKQCEEFGEVVL